jgi:starvation-inducible outer membrane lipoprotein
MEINKIRKGGKMASKVVIVLALALLLLSVTSLVITLTRPAPELAPSVTQGKVLAYVPAVTEPVSVTGRVVANVVTTK